MITVDNIIQVAKVAKQIYDAVKLADANTEQSMILNKRVQVIAEHVQALQSVLLSKPILEKALKDLIATLEDCLDFIISFQKKNWISKVIFGGSHETQFKEYNDKLQRSIGDLQLGIGVQTIYDQVADRVSEKKAAEKDAAQLQLLLSKVEEVGDDVKQLLEEFKRLRFQHALPVTSDPIEDLKRRYGIKFIELQFSSTMQKNIVFEWHQGTYLAQSVIIKKPSVLTSEIKRELFHEIAVLSRLRHSSILEFYGACFETGHECLVMEHIKGKLTEQIALLTTFEKINIARQIAGALHYLHCNEVIHDALSTDVIMMTSDNRAKLTGFGFSQTQATTVRALGMEKKEINILAWVAPERISLKGESPKTKSSDIYSFGLILWSLLSGRLPYQGLSDTDIFLKKHLFQSEIIPSHIPPEISKIITDCWNKNTAARPSTGDIIAVLSKLSTTISASVVNPPIETAYDLGTKAEQKGDFVNARKHYEQAILQGNIKAKTNLGFFYIKKLAGLNDPIKAFQLFMEAATGKPKVHNRAMFNVGLCYQKGIGTSVNLVLAKQWYQKALENGFTEAQAALDKLLKS